MTNVYNLITITQQIVLSKLLAVLILILMMRLPLLQCDLFEAHGRKLTFLFTFAVCRMKKIKPHQFRINIQSNDQALHHCRWMFFNLCKMFHRDLIKQIKGFFFFFFLLTHAFFFLLSNWFKMLQKKKEDKSQLIFKVERIERVFFFSRLLWPMCSKLQMEWIGELIMLKWKVQLNSAQIWMQRKRENDDCARLQQRWEWTKTLMCLQEHL